MSPELSSLKFMPEVICSHDNDGNKYDFSSRFAFLAFFHMFYGISMREVGSRAVNLSPSCSIFEIQRIDAKK